MHIYLRIAGVLGWRVLFFVAKRRRGSATSSGMAEQNIKIANQSRSVTFTWARNQGFREVYNILNFDRFGPGTKVSNGFSSVSKRPKIKTRSTSDVRRCSDMMNFDLCVSIFRFAICRLCKGLSCDFCKLAKTGGY